MRGAGGSPEQAQFGRGLSTARPSATLERRPDTAYHVKRCRGQDLNPHYPQTTGPSSNPVHESWPYARLTSSINVQPVGSPANFAALAPRISRFSSSERKFACVVTIVRFCL